MGFIKQIFNQDKSIIIKAKMDESLKAIISRILKSKWQLYSIDEEPIDSAWVQQKPYAYLIDTTAEEITEAQIKAKLKERCIILAEWNSKLELGIDLIEISRISESGVAISTVNEWIQFLGYSQKIDRELWQKIYRTNYSIYFDIEKTLIAYSQITEHNFKQILETTILDTNLSTLLTAILTSNSKPAFDELEKAWDSGLELEKTLAWVAGKLDAFLYHFTRGERITESMDKANITGTLRGIIERMTMKINKQLPKKIYKILHKYHNEENKIKDILILTELLIGV